MAEALAENISEVNLNDKTLQDIFIEGWNIYEELEQTNMSTNSKEFQEKVKTGMKRFELATRMVSQIGMFSSNEVIDEVATEALQYMLLPLFLGKMALKMSTEDRLQTLNVAEVYFKDYLQRCEEYDLCDERKTTSDNKTVASGNEKNDEMAQLMRAAHARNNKIAQFKRKKELEEQIKKMKHAVLANCIDEESKREFFLNFLKKGIIDANEELDSLNMEKQMVEMHKMHKSTGSHNINSIDNLEQPSISGNSHEHGHSHHSHAHGNGHSHHMHQKSNQPKKLQPFIITRDATQKAVFGMGYPSLPIMTVGEFYQQRVQDGIFPDDEKIKQMNQAQAIAAAQNENEKEDEEKAVVEEQIENDDEEYLARMRRMDEYKDVVRRGDGNRYNRS